MVYLGLRERTLKSLFVCLLIFQWFFKVQFLEQQHPSITLELVRNETSGIPGRWQSRQDQDSVSLPGQRLYWQNLL